MNDSKVGGKYRWSLIIVMALVWVFIYLQRTNISMLLVDYRFLAEVNLLNQPAQQGLLVTMFLLAYAVANMLSIPISSRLGPRRTLMFGIAVGSFVLMLGGWAASFAAILWFVFSPVLPMVFSIPTSVFSLKTGFRRRNAVRPMLFTPWEAV